MKFNNNSIFQFKRTSINFVHAFVLQEFLAKAWRVVFLLSWERRARPLGGDLADTQKHVHVLPY